MLADTVAAMDFSSLKDQVANLTLYDIKAGVRKVQNGTVTLVGLHPVQINANAL